MLELKSPQFIEPDPAVPHTMRWIPYNNSNVAHRGIPEIKSTPKLMATFFQNDVFCPTYLQIESKKSYQQQA